jgi:hypothetical protein
VLAAGRATPGPALAAQIQILASCLAHKPCNYFPAGHASSANWVEQSASKCSWERVPGSGGKACREGRSYLPAGPCPPGQHSADTPAADRLKAARPPQGLARMHLLSPTCAPLSSSRLLAGFLQIVAGLEPENTNAFLQMLGRAALQSDGTQAVKVRCLQTILDTAGAQHPPKLVGGSLRPLPTTYWAAWIS